MVRARLWVLGFVVLFTLASVGAVILAGMRYRLSSFRSYMLLTLPELPVVLIDRILLYSVSDLCLAWYRTLSLSRSTVWWPGEVALVLLLVLLFVECVCPYCFAARGLGRKPRPSRSAFSRRSACAAAPGSSVLWSSRTSRTNSEGTHLHEPGAPGVCDTAERGRGLLLDAPPQA